MKKCDFVNCLQTTSVFPNQALIVWMIKIDIKIGLWEIFNEDSVSLFSTSLSYSQIFFSQEFHDHFPPKKNHL